MRWKNFWINGKEGKKDMVFFFYGLASFEREGTDKTKA